MFTIRVLGIIGFGDLINGKESISFVAKE